MDQASADMSGLSMSEAQPQQSSTSHATAPDRPEPAPPSPQPAAAAAAGEDDEDMDEEEESRQEALQHIQTQLDKSDNRCGIPCILEAAQSAACPVVDDPEERSYLQSSTD